MPIIVGMLTLRLILLAPLLFGLWWVLSGYPVPLLLGLGAATAISAALLSPSMFVPRVRWLGWLIYAPWLLTRIILANLHVATLVFKPLDKLAPRIFTYRSTLKAFTQRAVLAQSITLTPGTITAVVNEDDTELTIHGIDEDSCSDVTTGLMEKQIIRFLGETKK